MLYAMNNSAFLIEPFADGIVKYFLPVFPRVYKGSFRHKVEEWTKFGLVGRNETFEYPLDLRELGLASGQKVRLYRAEQDLVVKVAGIEFLLSNGKTERSVCLSGYTFKNQL
ncbi:MAG: hypothetical protein AABY03_00315 [Nanoarchaeota archaeon]